MKTELIMKVGFIFNDENKGKRIVGGTDLKYPTEDLRWLDFTEKNIIIRAQKEDIYFKVKKIDVFSSIAGLINVGLTLYDNNDQFELINTGDEVYKIFAMVTLI